VYHVLQIFQNQKKKGRRLEKVKKKMLSDIANLTHKFFRKPKVPEKNHFNKHQ